jgi:hypothetical protein
MVNPPSCAVAPQVSKFPAEAISISNLSYTLCVKTSRRLMTLLAFLPK